MSLLAVTLLGDDRPGIIADTTEALARLGTNIQDSSMTLLRGCFAMTLICASSAPAAEVERSLAPLGADGSLVVWVREVRSEPAVPGTGSPYVLSVHGGDRPGIVSALTRVVADAGGNITDLTTRLSGDLYVLMAEVDLPFPADVPGLRARLEATAATLGVAATLRPADTDVL